MSSLSSILPIGEGDNSFSAVSSGTVTKGAAVIINVDGTVSTPSTGITSVNFIGIALATVTTGNSVVIETLGGQANTFDGLTIGSDYYTSSAGAISTTSAGNIKIGRAVTTSSINLRDYS